MKDLFTAETRFLLYRIWWIAGVIAGAVMAGFAAVPGATLPTWLIVAFAVFAFLGSALGFQAQENTPVEGKRRADAPEDPGRGEIEQYPTL